MSSGTWPEESHGPSPSHVGHRHGRPRAATVVPAQPQPWARISQGLGDTLGLVGALIAQQVADSVSHRKIYSIKKHPYQEGKCLDTRERELVKAEQQGRIQ